MTSSRPEVGSQFGPYLLTRLIGAGGMGSVFEAQDTVMDRVVALKLISGPYSQDQEYRQRLQREARIAGRLQDPHVVPVHSTGEIDGQLYVDMRLIDGTDLDTILKQSGPLPPVRAVAIIRQVASALDSAHKAGVLHRDVKPGNVIITNDDFAYLVDFGIANAATEQKLTQMGDVLGTWDYMAPERFTGDETKVTPSADTYALACVLYEALTGLPPYTGDRVSLIGAHLSQPVPRASERTGLPPALDDVIARGMAKQPQDRYSSSGELARAAEAAVATLSDRTANIALPTMAGPPQPQSPSGPHYTPQPPADATQYAQQVPADATQYAQQVPGSPAQYPPPAQTGSATQYAPQYPSPPTNPPTPYGGNTGQYGSPTNPPGPPAPAPKKRGQWIAIAAAIALVVAVAAGVGIWKLTSSKSSGKQAIDLSKLDVGHYGTKPRQLPTTTTVDEGRALAAFQVAEGAANPYDVDNQLDHVYGNAAVDTKTAAASISGTGTPLVQPVMEKYGMITGYIVEGFNKRFSDFSRDKSGELLMLMLTTYPTEDAAAKAADEIDSTDFAVNPENRGLTIPDYPQAKGHFRPGSPSIGVTMATGRVVTSVIARSDAHADLDYLEQRVKKAFDLQTPLINKLPLLQTEAGLTALPLDPDHMLSRIFVSGDQPKVSATFGNIGPHAALFCQDAQAQKDGLFQQAGVDRCAFSTEGSIVRTKDEATATANVSKFFESDRQEFVDHDVPAPDGVPNAKCYEQKQAIWADNANSRFACYLSFGRYIAQVSSADEKDVRERAAAQYAILVNSD